MRGRTVILVSHHVQLCTPGASYIVALDNGHLEFQGSRDDFMSSGVLQSLSQSGAADTSDEKKETQVHDIEELAAQPAHLSADSEASSTTAAAATELETKPELKKAPRKLIEEEKRAVGRISKDIWLTYLGACGGWLYWTLFITILTLAATGPVLENWWLKYVEFANDRDVPDDCLFQSLVWLDVGKHQRKGSCLLHLGLCRRKSNNLHSSLHY